MANEQNLIPGAHKLTVEEASRGGKASVEARRKRKQMKETLEILMNMTMNPGPHSEIDNITSLKDVKGKNLNIQEAIMVTQVQKALKGDAAAITFIRDMLGEKPGDKMEITGAIPVVISGEDDLED